MGDVNGGLWHWALVQAVALAHGSLPVAMRVHRELVAVLPLYGVALGWLTQRLRWSRRHGSLWGVALIWRIGWQVLSLIVLLTFGLLVALARSEGRAPMSSWRRF